MDMSNTERVLGWLQGLVDAQILGGYVTDSLEDIDERISDERIAGLLGEFAEFSKTQPEGLLLPSSEYSALVSELLHCVFLAVVRDSYRPRLRVTDPDE